MVQIVLQPMLAWWKLTEAAQIPRNAGRTLLAITQKNVFLCGDLNYIKAQVTIISHNKLDIVLIEMMDDIGSNVFTGVHYCNLSV